MIRAVIIEDEKCIAAELQKQLRSLPLQVEVTAVLDSIEQSVKYFSESSGEDLIFSDIQLSDGLCFDIFDRVNVEAPVVFVTGFDTFMTSALEHNGIDYLLKPVEDADLLKVIDKYKNLERHFIQRRNIMNFCGRSRQRLVVRKGFTNVPLRLEDIVFFYTESKIVYVMDKEGKKYICDQNLSDLENLLDRNHFFRANRQYIINIAFIRAYKSHERVKLHVDISSDGQSHSVVISQESAPCFKKWINDN